MSAESIKIASWNLEDALSQRARLYDVVNRIKSLDADIVMLPDAFRKAADNYYEHIDDEETVVLAETELAAAGYEVEVRPYYPDTERRKDDRWFVALKRPSVHASVGRLVLGSRETLTAKLAELPLTITGVHLDDSDEAIRQQQALLLVEEHPATQPNILMGNFNAMHRRDRKARVLPAAEFVANHLQLAAMADGGTMASLERYGYQDVDPNLQATYGPAQIDHILTNFAATGDDEWLQVTNYTVHDVPKAESNHRVLTATIEY